MYRHSRTLSTLEGLSLWTRRPCKHLATVSFVMMLLAPNIRCSPLPCKDIRNEPFATYVSNPCLAREPAALSNFTEEEMLFLRRIILNDTLPGIINSYKSDAEEMLKENVDSVCRNDTYSHLSNVTTSNSLQGKEEVEAMLDIYFSLLIHIASVHHVYEQDLKYSDTSCQSNRPNHSTFANRTKRLGAGLIEITCEVHMALLTYAVVGESVLANRSESALNTILCDNHLCGRRILNDCRTIKSTFALLDTFGNYLQKL